MNIGIAIFGTGRWGVHLIRNFQQHPNSRVVAVVDPNERRLKEIRERFNFDSDVLVTSNCSEAMEAPGIDAVAIATPASTHYDLVKEALNRGYHVFAEKPLTLNYSESLELSQLAEKQQRQLFVDRTYLFHSAVEGGKKVVGSGKLGELRYGYGTRTHLEPVRQDVDALWDLAIHDLCIFNSWLGETPDRVQAFGTAWLPNGGLSDLVTAKLIYPSGFQAFLHMCWLNPDKQRRLAVVGSEGTLIFDEMSSEAPLTLQQGHLEREGDRWKAGAGQSREIVAIEKAEPLAKACDRFLSLIRDNTCSSFSAEAGVELVKILCGLSESLQQGGDIVQLL
ncbi:MAG: Gfo/Idh/MocA family oxidoreductase [Cyanobacteriota bacterium]|nr:Gfo/Idh/MocA family oxidoreductase [Cyanobacteriota bacterium]